MTDRYYESQYGVSVPVVQSASDLILQVAPGKKVYATDNTAVAGVPFIQQVFPAVPSDSYDINPNTFNPASQTLISMGNDAPRALLATFNIAADAGLKTKNCFIVTGSVFVSAWSSNVGMDNDTFIYLTGNASNAPDAGTTSVFPVRFTGASGSGTSAFYVHFQCLYYSTLVTTAPAALYLVYGKTQTTAGSGIVTLGGTNDVASGAGIGFPRNIMGYIKA